MSSKNWFQKLQPGKLLAPIVERFVPGGSAIVGAYRNVESAVKRTVSAPVRQQAAQANARGVPVSQVAAEQAAIARDMYPESSKAPAAPSSVPTVIVAGVVLAVMLLWRRR